MLLVTLLLVSWLLYVLRAVCYYQCFQKYCVEQAAESFVKSFYSMHDTWLTIQLSVRVPINYWFVIWHLAWRGAFWWFLACCCASCVVEVVFMYVRAYVHFLSTCLLQIYGITVTSGLYCHFISFVLLFSFLLSLFCIRISLDLRVVFFVGSERSPATVCCWSW